MKKVGCILLSIGIFFFVLFAYQANNYENVIHNCHTRIIGNSVEDCIVPSQPVVEYVGELLAGFVLSGTGIIVIAKYRIKRNDTQKS